MSHCNNMFLWVVFGVVRGVVCCGLFPGLQIGLQFSAIPYKITLCRGLQIGLLCGLSGNKITLHLTTRMQGYIFIRLFVFFAFRFVIHPAKRVHINPLSFVYLYALKSFEVFVYYRPALYTLSQKYLLKRDL